MPIRAIAPGIERDQIDELHALYAYQGSFEFIRRYVTSPVLRIVDKVHGNRGIEKLRFPISVSIYSPAPPQ